MGYPGRVELDPMWMTFALSYRMMSDSSVPQQARTLYPGNYKLWTLNFKNDEEIFGNWRLEKLSCVTGTGMQHCCKSTKQAQFQYLIYKKFILRLWAPLQWIKKSHPFGHVWEQSLDNLRWILSGGIDYTNSTLQGSNSCFLNSIFWCVWIAGNRVKR